MEKLPILISVPHGGGLIPPELIERTDLVEKDIFWDSDGCTRQIFGFKEEVTTWIDSDVARAFIDLNRNRLDRAPKKPDGVVKSQTCFEVPVYKPGAFPDDKLIEELLKKYYDPFHHKLNKAFIGTNIKLAIDCHSMLPLSPTTYQNPGSQRPLFCLSNGGNQSGEQICDKKPISCSPEILRLLRQLLVEEFNVLESDVLLNDPFNGGFIIRSHKEISRKPWIQFEINRKLYIKSNEFGSDRYDVSNKSINRLREKILAVFQRLVKML